MPDAFNLVDIFILLGISQGILLSITLWLTIHKNRKANTILCFLLLIAMTMLTGRFLFFRYLNYWIFQWSLWVDSVIFLFGPLLYTYVRRLLLAEKFNYRLPLYHFIPFASMILISLFSVITFTPEEYYTLYVDGKLQAFFTTIIFLGIILNAYYLYHAFNLIKTYRSQAQSNLSFRQNQIQFLRFYLATVALFLGLWVLNVINQSIFDTSMTFINYDSIWATISISIYVVGYFSLKQPELFRLPYETPQKQIKERLSKVEIEMLKKEIDTLMEGEKLYLRSDLTMKELADKLQTSTNNISWLLNTVYKVNFYDFINQLRVQEFVKRVEEKAHIQRTILGLSKDVGFKSKSTFYKSFKLSMQETPSNYIKKLHGTL